MKIKHYPLGIAKVLDFNILEIELLFLKNELVLNKQLAFLVTKSFSNTFIYLMGHNQFSFYNTNFKLQTRITFNKNKGKIVSEIFTDKHKTSSNYFISRRKTQTSQILVID